MGTDVPFRLRQFGGWAIAAFCGVAVTVLGLAAIGGPAVWGAVGFAAVVLLLALRPGTSLSRLALMLVGAYTMVGTSSGLQISEVVYGLLMVAYLGGWYLSRWLQSRPLIVSSTDMAMALWLTVGVGGAACLGLVFGARPTSYVQEILGMITMYYYFPAKEACAESERGLWVVVSSFLALGAYATINGAIRLRSAIASADLVYEIADARFVAGESFMALGILLGLGLSVGARTWRGRGVALVVTSIVLGGLVLTRTRSFWISTLLGLAVMLLVATSEERRRTVLFLGIGSAVLLGIAAIQFREQLMFLIAGTVGRFASLDGAAGSDLSLLGRFAEYKALFDKISLNPFLGYGWGVPYSHFTPLNNTTRTWSFSHNGWLYIWYKTGLWGLAIMGFAWLSAVASSVKSSRASWMPPAQRALGSAIAGGIVTYLIALNAANPFFGQDTVLAVALTLAMASGLGQRRRALHVTALSGRLAS